MDNKSKLFIILATVNSMALATVTASVDRNQVTLGQSFNLTIDAANGTPDLQPLTTDFEVLGTSNSSQMSIINGKTSSQKSYIVTLTAKTSGKLLIPPLSVGNDKTNSLMVQVTPPSKAAAALAKEQLFVVTELSDYSSYPGVPVVLSVKFFYSQPVANVTMSDLKVDNATVQPSGKTIQYSANENGRNYQVSEQKFLLTANQSGKLVIPPVRISGALSSGGSDIFGMFNNQPFNTQSQPQTIVIKPLPAGFSSSNWLPAKELLMNESWSLNSLQVNNGDPITRTITVQALGISGSAIPDFSFAAPTVVKVYPDKSQTGDSVTNDGVLGQRVFKIAYVPTKNGTVTFPPISIKWWNIASNREETTTLPAKTVTVAGVATNVSNLAASTATQAGSLIKNPVAVSTNIRENPKRAADFWQYLTVIFAGLWLVTSAVAVVLWRRKIPHKPAHATTQRDNNLQPANAAAINSQLKLLLTACDERNSAQVATELIKWARLNWQQPLHSLADICHLLPDLPELVTQLRVLEASLYGTGKFADFTHLKHLLAAGDFKKSTKSSVADLSLAELYPTKANNRN